MDLAALTDAELEAHRFAVRAEQERRTAAGTTPGQVEELAARFVKDGGDLEALRAALVRGWKRTKVTPPPEPDPPASHLPAPSSEPTPADPTPPAEPEPVAPEQEPDPKASALEPAPEAGTSGT